MEGFKKAKKEKIWAKILLGGASGSGKSYSALRLAKGLANKCGSRIAAIDTENGRIRYYASEFDFDDMQLEAPYTPEKYIEAIDVAVQEGFQVLIVDSISHEWNYCVDIHDKMPGNSWTNWSKVTPRHDLFMEKVLQSQLHIIATVRGKDEYVLEEKNGKQTPKKVGLGYKQRDGVEYEYTATFNIAQDTHIAEATKDNTHIFEGRYEVLTEKDGEAIYDWANSGESVKAAPKATTPIKAPVEIEDDGQALDNLHKEINALAMKLGGSKNDKLIEYIEKTLGEKNPNKCNDEEKLNALLKGLKIKDKKGGK